MAHVLVVDDDAIVRSIVAQFLQFGGHSAVQVASGAEAIAHLSNELPDLVITDFSMPGMTGLELRSTLREMAPSVPCVVMSGHIMDPGVRSEFDAVLEKPLGCRLLIDTVRQVVDQARAVA